MSQEEIEKLHEEYKKKIQQIVKVGIYSVIKKVALFVIYYINWDPNFFGSQSQPEFKVLQLP